jgi:hypothetical protein
MATAACNTCLGGSIGTGRSCDENVSDKCVADPECLAQQTCVAENCISKP